MVLGTLLACPHCGDCIEIFGEAPKPQQELTCDCGGLLEVAEAFEVDIDIAAGRSAARAVFEARGGTS